LAGQRRLISRLLLILLAVPPLVLADVAQMDLALRPARDIVPFQCGGCHGDMTAKLLKARYPHHAGQGSQAANVEADVRCYLCHVDMRRACRFATVADPTPRYEHALQLPLRRDGEYRLRLRSRNTRAEAVCPRQGALVFETKPRKFYGNTEQRIGETGDRLQICRVNLTMTDAGQGLLTWQTNLKADSEAILWPSKTEKGGEEHLPVKEDRAAGIDECRACHPMSRFQVSHPVGVRLRSQMQNCGLPTATGGVLTCATCHDPHGSRHAYILRDEQDRLCTRCHIGY